MEEFKLRQTEINKELIVKNINKVFNLGLINDESKQIMLDKTQDSCNHKEILDEIDSILERTEFVLEIIKGQ